MQFIVPFDQIGVTPPGPWQNANPSAGVQGSIPNADFFTAVQAEILAAINEAGLTPSAADLAQLLRAMRSGLLWTFADAGTTANAITIVPKTAHTALIKGLPFRIWPGASNTATDPTLTVGTGTGLTAVIRRRDQSKIGVGDILVGQPIDVVFDGTYFRILSVVPSEITNISNASAVTLAQTLINNFPSISPPKNGRFFQVGGTFVMTIGGGGPNDPPAGVTDVYFTLSGPGGGGAAASSGSNSYSGGGGASGGVVADWIRGLATGDKITLINGSGGLGGSPGNGNFGATGTTSSLSATPTNGKAVSLIATGGSGGAGGTVTCTGGNPGVGSGSSLGYNLRGAPGGDGNPGNLLAQGGAGGASVFGGGGRTSTVGPTGGSTTSNVANGLAPGSGGGGIWQNSDGLQHGGNGADGGAYGQW